MEKQTLWIKVSSILHFASLMGLFIGIYSFYRYLPWDEANFGLHNAASVLFLLTNILSLVSALLWLGTLIVLLYWFFRSWKESRQDKGESTSSGTKK